MIATTDTRTEKMQTILATLEKGVAGILTSEAYARYLRAMSRFHGYSFNNTLLIVLAKPEATYVAGFHTWKSLSRSVRKGEKGIPIMVPYRGKIGEDENGESVYALRGFGIGHVFDVSQTDGEPLPAGPQMSEQFDGEADTSGLTDALTALVATEGATIVATAEGPRGHWQPTRREIGVRRDLDGIGYIKTLTHEVAHMLADHRAGVDRNDAEDVAESAAYVVLSHFGIDTGGYSFGYIARWAKEVEIVRRNLGEVQRIAHRIIDAIEEHGATPPA